MKKKNYIIPFIEQTTYVMFTGLCASPGTPASVGDSGSGEKPGATSSGGAPGRKVF